MQPIPYERLARIPPANSRPLFQTLQQPIGLPTLGDPVEDVVEPERWFPERSLILWHLFGIIILYLILTPRTVVLTFLSIFLHFLGASRQISPFLALTTVFFLPQHYFKDQDIYSDPILALLENLSRTMLSCIWSYGIVYWLRFLCGWGL